MNFWIYSPSERKMFKDQKIISNFEIEPINCFLHKALIFLNLFRCIWKGSCNFFWWWGSQQHFDPLRIGILYLNVTLWDANFYVRESVTVTTNNDLFVRSGRTPAAICRLNSSVTSLAARLWKHFSRKFLSQFIKGSMRYQYAVLANRKAKLE